MLILLAIVLVYCKLDIYLKKDNGIEAFYSVPENPIKNVLPYAKKEKIALLLGAAALTNTCMLYSAKI